LLHTTVDEHRELDFSTKKLPRKKAAEISQEREKKSETVLKKNFHDRYPRFRAVNVGGEIPRTSRLFHQSQKPTTKKILKVMVKSLPHVKR